MTYSTQLFDSAQRYLPGGVSSPVRSFSGVSGDPIFIKQGKGPYLIDVDDKKYIDYVCSWGPLIVGHAHPYILEKVTERLQDGFSFGAPTEIEIRLAEKITHLMPSIEKLRFVSSGTEAAMSAIRVARGYTKRNKILKFAGCYHGHADSLLVAAGSGGLTFGVPSSAGVPQAVTQDTLVAEFNRLDQVEALFAKYGNEIACILVEPVAGNMNLVLPQPGFLAGLRDICDRYQSLLIFDEVITGFRVALGGAQAYFSIKPDLTILGKIIGGGFPAAAFGGRAEVMDVIAPLGPVYQAGTLSGNPIAMTAGLATLELISTPDFYTQLTEQTAFLAQGLTKAANKANVSVLTYAIGGLFGVYFTELKKIETEAEVKLSRVDLFKRFFRGMLERGIYLAPSAFEVGFVSSAHTKADIDQTLSTASDVLQALATELA